MISTRELMGPEVIRHLGLDASAACKPLGCEDFRDHNSHFVPSIG